MFDSGIINPYICPEGCQNIPDKVRSVGMCTPRSFAKSVFQIRHHEVSWPVVNLVPRQVKQSANQKDNSVVGSNLEAVCELWQ